MVQPTKSTEVVALKTSTGDQIYTLFGKATKPDRSPDPDSASRPSLIYFYGNAMCLADTTELCRDWRQLGANVLAVEYPGYGMSSGKAGEAPFYAAAEAAYDYLAARPDIDKTKIIPFGQSLGTGVAVELATRRPVAGLALFSAYTSMDDMARLVLPIMPTWLILRHHFRNEQKIENLHCPILIVHGNHDSIIPVEMSHRLAAAAKNARVTELYVDSDHNDVFEKAGKEADEALAKLIEQVAESHQ